MSKKIFISLIVLVLIIVAGIFLVVRREKSQDAVLPVLYVSAFNKTKNADAVSTSAGEGDTVVYTLTVENQTDKIIPGYIIEANISEVADKATLVQAQGASFNVATNSLVWTPLDIPAKGSIKKDFSVQVNKVPAGSTNTVMRIKFNNPVEVSIAKPVVAGVATTPGSSEPYKAPVTGPSGYIVLAFAIAATASYALIRKFAFKRI